MRASLLLLLVSTGVASAQLPGLSELPVGLKTDKDIAYGEHERQKLDLFVPKSDKPLPLIVWIHGGGWTAGDKSQNPALLLLTHGYAVASTNYRFSQHAPFPAQIYDCKAAIRYLRANAKKYNLDADKIGVWGGSAGGHLVSLLGTSADVKSLEGDGANPGVSTRVQAVCDWFGPNDMTKLVSPGASNLITKLIGGDIKDKEAVAISANPITHIGKDCAPFLIVHGDKDTLVPLEQSVILDKALKAKGIPSELLVFKGAGHADNVFIQEALAKENFSKMTKFFDKHLKK